MSETLRRLFMRERRNWIPLIVLAAFFVFPVFRILGSEIPEKLVINDQGYKSVKKGPVPFNHQAHAEDYGVACDECHHVYKNGKNVWEEGDQVQKCIACHDPRESKGDVKKLQIAFHRNCIDCHKESGSTEAPYKRCYGCHKKK
jgi:hypothetical protein